MIAVHILRVLHAFLFWPLAAWHQAAKPVGLAALKPFSGTSFSTGKPLLRLFTMHSVIKPSCMSLEDFDCIGLDIDHTLCKYKLDNFFPVRTEIEI